MHRVGPKDPALILDRPGLPNQGRLLKELSPIDLARGEDEFDLLVPIFKKQMPPSWIIL
jgi:hypothetical protein